MSEIKSWPFKEAHRLLKYSKNNKKNFVAFETGYGPSGIPHIGTFAEVLRTNFVINAFHQISDIPTKLICFSDDFDGLRKIPENLPGEIDLGSYIDVPLTNVPDPFQKERSFGDYMNKMLCKFLDHFGFDYEFYSATEFYKSGKFDNFLIKILEKHEEIVNIVAPTLGEERKKSYSPFLPVCKKTGKILQVKIEKIDLSKNSIFYFDHEGDLVESQVTGGNTKLQWKADFGMRWAALDIDFEIYGKEHAPNANIYQKICRLLDGNPPIQFVYELFLDKDGTKISKSKGNSISLDELIKYAPLEAISLFIYNSPQRAKKLDWNVVPQFIDEYLALNKKYFLDDVVKENNPLYHIHKGNVPQIKHTTINFSFLINLISACNSLDKKFLWKFIERDNPLLDDVSKNYYFNILEYAVRYYKDILNKDHKKVTISDDQKVIFEHILKILESSSPYDLTADFIQNQLYSLGKTLGYEDLRSYFKKIYTGLLNQEKGPRLGSFIKFFGIENTKKLIKEKLSQI
ncbi:MAG: lysine--tRNA ligase [Rickettsia sp.]|nr:lysine--tRNA ligase [Rickettsia sp.]